MVQRGADLRAPDPVQDLLRECWDDVLRFEEEAIQDGAGRDPVDHLPRANPEAVQERLNLYRSWRKRIDSLHDLTLAQRQERELFGAWHELFDYVQGELQGWKHNPDAFSELGELFFLDLTTDRDDKEAHHSAVLGQMQDIPRYLEDVRTRVEVADILWSQTAVDAAAGMGPLLQALVGAARGDGFVRLSRAMEGTIPKVGEAVAEHVSWIQDQVPKREGVWKLTEEQFAELIQRKQLGMDVDDVRAFGCQQRAQLAEAVEGAAKALGCDSVREAQAKLQKDSPKDFDGVLEMIVEFASRMRDVVAQRDLVPILEPEVLEVRRTPDFLAPLVPIAALCSSGPLDSVQKGIYLVTEPSSGDMSFFDPHRWIGIAAHEGYPGHHLQLAHANRLPSPLRAGALFGAFPRDARARFALDLIEGWAHHCEEWMKEEGLGDGKESRFSMLIDQQFRALRVVVDCDLSSGKMSMEEAQRLLVEEALLTPALARSEVARYTRSAGYQLSYLVGKNQIQDYRASERRRLGSEYSDTDFHEGLMDAGIAPVSMIRRFAQEAREESR